MNKQNILALLFAAVLLTTTFIAGCKKEDDDDNNNTDDWAAAVAGTYTGTATEYSTDYSATTVITRISDTKLNLQLSYSGETTCLDSVTMNTATTISISEFNGCQAVSASGGGGFTGSTLNYTWTSAGGSSHSITFTGTK